MKTQEIERKYLVRDRSCLEHAVKAYRIVQGYICLAPTVRVRLRDDEAYLTIKGESDASGLMRSEWEYTIPAGEAEGLLRLAGERLVEKRRYIVPYEGEQWEVDVFEGRHAGLIIAELELDSPEQEFSLPEWLGREVTGDARYYNAALSLRSDLPPLD